VKSLFGNFLISLGAAYLLHQLEVLIESNFLIPFLKGNLVTIILSLLAINAATLSIVLTKLRELLDASSVEGAFSGTRKAMLWSVYEQIFLVFISVALLIVLDSKWILSKPNVLDGLSVLLIGCFVFSIIILLDTAKSVFVILDFSGKR